MRYPDGGGPGRLAGLRRRVRSGPETAKGTYLGTARPYPSGEDVGGSNTRVSSAALVATRPDHAARLIYRTRTGRGNDQRKGFTETDYAGSWTPTSSSAARS